MSILIKGMKMPKDGYIDIRLFSDGWAHIPTDEPTYYNRAFEAIEIPPHGRLGDLDALWEKEKSEHALKKHRPKNQSIIFDAGFLAGFRAAAQIASKMPTIIPADPVGGADG